MRLFVAVELTDEARAAIVAQQNWVASAVRCADRALRLVRPEHLHLTLAFIGDVSEDHAAAIVGAMSSDIQQVPFEIVFAGVRVFPPQGRPRVLWLDMTAGERETIELERRVALRLERTGVDLDPRPFQPHLTLGRWRDCRRSGRLERAEGRGGLRGDSPKLDWPPEIHGAKVASMVVAAVTLFQSRLSSSGPTYTRLAGARLTCS